MITSDVGPWGIVPRALIHDLAGDTTVIAVYALLSSYADRRHDDGWTMSRKQICDETGLGLTTVKRCLRVLRDTGWLEIHHEYKDNGDQGWSRYIVHVVRSESDQGGAPDGPTPLHQATGVGRQGDHLPQTPLTDPSTDPSLRGEVVNVDFERFWLTYNRTGSKKVAYECWRKALKKEDGDPRLIQAGLEQWMDYWSQPEAAKMKWPQGWLNEERWRVDPPVIARKRRSAPGMDRLREIWDAEEAKNEGGGA